MGKVAPGALEQSSLHGLQCRLALGSRLCYSVTWRVGDQRPKVSGRGWAAVTAPLPAAKEIENQRTTVTEKDRERRKRRDVSVEVIEGMPGQLHD